LSFVSLGVSFIDMMQRILDCSPGTVLAVNLGGVYVEDAAQKAPSRQLDEL